MMNGSHASSQRKSGPNHKSQITNHKSQITSTTLLVNVQDDSVMEGRPTPNANLGRAQSRLWLHRRLEGQQTSFLLLRSLALSMG